MYLILFGLLLFSISSSLAYVFKRQFEETLPVTLLLIIMTMYVCSIFFSLQVGYFAILVLGGVCFVFSGYYLVKNKKMFLEKIVTPGFMVFCLLIVFVWWAHRGRVISLWDEFSHWGLTVKNMFELNVLGNHDMATTTFKSYPPAIALLQYFMQRLSGVFIEGNLYRAMNIFSISLLLPLFKLIKWSDFKKIPYVLFIVLVIPLTFYYEFYHTIYVDAILGVLFGYTLVTYFTNKMEIFNLLSVTLGLAVLTLTKDSGFGLAVIAMLVIGCDLLLFNRSELVDFYKKNKLVNKIMVILPVLSLLFAKYSWSTYLKVTSTSDYWDNGGINLSNILSLYSDNIPVYRKETILNFFNALFTDKLTGFMVDITFIGMVVILIVLSVLLVKLCEDNQKRRMKTALYLTFVGGMIFTVSLLFIYLFTYNEAEATGLASLLRYLGTYLTGLFIFISYLLLTKLNESNVTLKKYMYPIAVLFLLIVVNVKPLINTTILAPYYIDNTLELRAPYFEMGQIINKVNTETEKVYVIAQNNRPAHLTANYILTPIQINTYDYSLGDPYGDIDPYTSNLSIDEWLIKLSDYDYVYLYRIDEQFITRYGQAFQNPEDIKNDGFYKIEKINDTITLVLNEY